MTFDQREHIVSCLTPRFGRGEAMAMAQWIAEEPDGSYDPEDVICRLLHDEPIQYIFGHTDWRGLRLQLSPDTLIPRPETSDLVDEVVSLVKALPENRPVSILDIGTGSGCIAIAMKKALPQAEVLACDISDGALLTARRNAEHNHADVHFFRQDILASDASESIRGYLSQDACLSWVYPGSILGLSPDHAHPFSKESNVSPFPLWEGFGDRAFLIVSNPPYICDSERENMDQNVLDYEPHRALFVPDSDPLLFYRAIARLRLAPLLCFEINERFGNLTAEMLRSEGYSSVEIIRDICGKERIIVAKH